LNIIVAVNSDWGIGHKGIQTIVIPEDRRYFKEMTSGGVVIIGRKTFESIGKPLPDRKNIILTKDRSFSADGAVAAHSVEDVLAEIANDDSGKAFVIGGGEIYRQFLPLCANAYVTKIEATPPSDIYFPDLDNLPAWALESESEIRYSESGIRYSFWKYKNNAAQIRI